MNCKKCNTEMVLEEPTAIELKCPACGHREDDMPIINLYSEWPGDSYDHDYRIDSLMRDSY